LKGRFVFLRRPVSSFLNGIVASLLFFSLLFTLSACGTEGTKGAGPFSVSSNAQQTLSSQNTLAALESEQLYQEVWAAVNREFVDGSMNGQNWQRWEARYKGKLHNLEDAYIASETMLASLDDAYTRLLIPRDFKEQNQSIDNRLFGVGMQITVKEGKLYVVGLLDDTPAQAAHILPGEQITHINGMATAGLNVEVCADRIRGPKGSTVLLRLEHSSHKPKLLRLQRAEINVKSVFSEALPHESKIGYIRLSSFISETVPEEMRLALQKIENKQGLILDLRGNYGGLLSNAVEVSDLFLQRSPVVYIEGRNPSSRQTLYADDDVDYGGDLVLLVDGASASASEIVSGALQDYRRAVLIGSTTFGKGLVQKIVPLPSGAGLNLTISHYKTPKGRDINHKGIAPDIAVPLNETDVIARKDKQLEAAIAWLHKKWKHQNQQALGPQTAALPATERLNKTPLAL
jgi:carboxyl-terminal processing protease